MVVSQLLICGVAHSLNPLVPVLPILLDDAMVIIVNGHKTVVPGQYFGAGAANVGRFVTLRLPLR